jgi:hypothetical protein
MAADTDMELNSAVEEELPPHLVRDTAKNPRNNIPKINLIFVMRTPP